jgi:uncharacterized protein YjiS (DUF1127 family)
MTQYVLAATEWLNFGGVFDFFRNLKRSYNRQQDIRHTMKELSALTDKELHDIGISRGDIWSIAHHDVDMKRSADVNRNLKGWV